MKDYKYKVGELVSIRKDIVNRKLRFSHKGDPKFPITDDMRDYAGEVVTIDYRFKSNLYQNTNIYMVKEFNVSCWSELMFESIEDLFD